MRRRNRPAPFASVEMLEIRRLLASATIGVRAVDSSGNPASDVYRTPPPNAPTGVHFEFVRSGDYIGPHTNYSYNISANPDNSDWFRLVDENWNPIAYPGPYSELHDIYVLPAGTTTPIPDVVLTLTLDTPVSCFGSIDWTVMPSSAMITIHGTPGTPTPRAPTPQAGDQGGENCPPDPQAMSQDGPGRAGLPSSGTKGNTNGFNGGVAVDPVAFMSDGFGRDWGLVTDWTSVSAYSAGGTYGKGFVNLYQPTLQPTSGDGYMAVSSATDVQWFDPDGAGGFVAKFFGQEKLAADGSGNLKVTDTRGGVTSFHGFGAGVPAAQRGKFKGFVAASGSQVTATYNASGQLTAQTRTDGTATETYAFTYLTSGVNSGLVAAATLARTSGGTTTTVRKVAYTYYDGSQPFGNAGNLQLERVLDPSDNVIDSTYFRYYTADGATGYADGMRYVFHPEAYARLAAAVPGHLTAPDSAVAPYADSYFEYDGDARVTKSVVQGAGCSCASSTGAGEFTYSYSTSSFPDGYNNWRSKTVETLPDGNQDVYYYNFAGELVLHAFLDLSDPADPSLVGKVWATSYRYDGLGRLIQTAQPSAVTIIDASLLASAEGYADLVGYNPANGGSYQYLSANAGVIRLEHYAGATTATAGTAGDAYGYPSADQIKRGYSGTPITLDSFLYLSRVDANGAATYPLASATVYSNEDGTGARTTSYAYTWLGSTAQPASIETTLPVVSAAQGGPGTADVSTTAYDTYGRPTWVRDEDGYLHYTAYDNGTGAVVKTIVDVDTSQSANFAGLPAGWTTRAGGGLNLIEIDQVDGLGRTTKRVDPSGSITHWVYKDAQHEVRTYRGWDPSGHTTTGPIEVTRQDRGLGYNEAFTAAVAPGYSGASGSFVPNGAETITSVLTLSRDILDLGQRVKETDDYFLLSGLTYSAASPQLGTAGTNYDVTTYGYDHMGRPSRVVDATGTIAATAFDSLGRQATESVGTADGYGATFGLPSNMVTIARYQYDAGGVGDSNLTRSTAYPGGGTADRVAEYAYDWRNRLVATKGGVQAGESADVQRQLIYLNLNNLGEVIAVSRYDGDTIPVSAVDPINLYATALRARSTSTYDGQGRPYLQKVFSVGQSTGAVSPTGLASQTYFDHRGNAIAVATSGGPATKSRHDGAGRVVAEATTDGAGGWTWAAAGSTAGDHVLTETRTTYDPAGNPILVATSDRAHDAIGLGTLASPGDGLVATYYAEDNFTGGTVGRLDPTVDFDWGNGQPHPAIEPDTFSATWRGYVEVPTSGTWTFYVLVNDGARLWVDDKLMFDDLNPAGSPRELSNAIPIALQAGRLYAIRLDYREVSGGASIALKWAGPGTAKQVIPQARLFSTPVPGDGLAATYYADDFLIGGTVSRIDPAVDFNWGTGGPHPAIDGDTFSATWLGYLDVPTSGTWTFTASADDGARAWVNNIVVFDDLNPGPSRNIASSMTVNLQAGRLYAIRMDYREVADGASVALKWSGPGTPTQVVPQARIHSTAGSGGGLAATYYAEDNFTGGTASRIDPAVDFDWGTGRPHPAIEPDTFSATWLGYVEVPAPGLWTFSALVDDGARLWVDGVSMFNDLGPGSTRELSNAVPIALQAGRMYSIRLDYREVSGGASVALKWSGPGTAKQVIPQARLFSTPVPGDGLAATYFAEDNFTGGTVSRIDPAVDFNWGIGGPHPAIDGDTFSARWVGYIEVPAPGLWTFSASVDDGAQLWVDGVSMFNDLGPGSTRELSNAVPITLQAGRMYAIRLDYREVNGNANVTLKWAGPGTDKQVIPQARLFSTAAYYPIAAPTNRARTSFAAFYYDDADRLTEAVNLGNNAGGVYNRPATPPARSDTALVTSYHYNPAGWVDQVTDPRGIHARTSYDALGRAVEVVANAPALPAALGPVTASANNTTRYTYDGLGQIRTLTAVMPAGTPSQTTTYVRGVTTAAGSAVNSNGLLAAIVQPDEATGALPDPADRASHQVAYAYNALGQVTKMTDPKGTVHEHSYDVLGRPLTDAVTNLGPGVDGAVQRRETAYDTAGRPYLFTNFNAATGGAVGNQVRDDFNGLGQLVAEYEEHNGAVNTATSPAVRYAYTEMVGGQDHSRLASMTYPNGRVVRYAYDAGIDSAIGRTTAIAEDASGSVGAVLESYKYLGLGTVVERARPQAGTKLSYLRQPGDANLIDDGNDPYTGLDRFGRIADQNWTRTAATPGGAIGSSTVRLQYRHDRDGNALARRDLVNIALSELYAYDSLNRLTSTKRGVLTAGTTGGPLDTVDTPARQQAWTLDALGNWSGVATNGTTTTRQFNAANQATAVSSATAPAYDTAGNTTTKDGKAYAYDAWNRLVAVKLGATTLAAYAYDALGRRVVETYPGSSTVTHVYFTPDWQAIEERNGGTAAANVAVQYVLGATGQVVLRDGYASGTLVAGSRRFVQQNANGDTMALVAGGDVVERFAYDAYGATTFLDASGATQAGSASGFRVLFQGGRFDAATGLYLFQHRDLDPTSGAWMQRDPIGLAGGDPNLRRFVGNNPVNLTDPSGLSVADFFGNVIAPGVYRESSRLDDELAAISNRSGDRDPISPLNGPLTARSGPGYWGNSIEYEFGRVGQYGTSMSAEVGRGLGEDVIVGKASGAVGGLIPASRPPRGMPKPPGRAPKPPGRAPKPSGSTGSHAFNRNPCPPPTIKSDLPGRVTGELSLGAGRTKEELKRARNFFEHHRDAARKWWEQREGKQWPDNATHYEHPRPLKDGGHPLFVEPGFNGPNSPHMIPGPDGLTDFQRWGGLRGRP